MYKDYLGKQEVLIVNKEYSYIGLNVLMIYGLIEFEIK